MRYHLHILTNLSFTCSRNFNLGKDNINHYNSDKLAGEVKWAFQEPTA